MLNCGVGCLAQKHLEHEAPIRRPRAPPRRVIGASLVILINGTR
jgi:hypothetical protein